MAAVVFASKPNLGRMKYCEEKMGRLTPAGHMQTYEDQHVCPQFQALLLHL